MACHERLLKVDGIMCRLYADKCPNRFGTKVHLWCRECIGEAINLSNGRVIILPPEPSVRKPPATEIRGI